MSFLVNLAKRKKSPEQLVKLAIACLHELPKIEGEGGDLAEADQGVSTDSGMQGAESGQRGHAGEEGDELMTSNHSAASTGSAGGAATSSFSRALSIGGDGSSSRRPSLIRNISSNAIRRLSSGGEQPPPSSAAAETPPSSMAGEAGASKGSSSKGSASSGKHHGLQVPSLFFSDPGKRHAASTPTGGTHLLQHSSSFGPNGEEATVLERLAKRLNQMKVILYGDGEKDVDKDKPQDLAEHVIKEDLFPLLMGHFNSLPFETRKDTAQIFNNLCRHNLGGFADPYIADEHFEVVRQLIEGYSNPEMALNCGTMLRECIRHEKIARHILFSESVWLFFDKYVHLPNFDVASDSFATLRELLTKHKALAAEFLDQNYDQVLARYKNLLKSENYVTRRMSLKMLGELLLDRSNFNVMLKFISSKENLKNVMNMLRDKSASIQYEAFHVFKVFVANPKKPPEITKILVTNREKLIAYLENFLIEKDDEQFREEKALLVGTLSKLEYTEELGLEVSGGDH